MYEHPAIAYQLIEFEREQLERAVERRRSLIERSDQIVPRPAGPVRRMLRRMFGTRRATAADAVAGTSAAAPAPASVSSERRAPGSCEPIPAR